MSPTRFPLFWPTGWKRTQYPVPSRFEPGSVFAESQSLMNELAKLGATKVIISSNMQYRNDGLPYTRQSVSDTGVAVYFDLEGRQQCIPCDKWLRLEDNLRAISKTIDALRGIERWGAKDMVSAAFKGFQALPESIVTSPPKRDWWVVLGVPKDADAPTVKQGYRKALSITHPDAGGSNEAFREAQDAYSNWLHG